MENLFASFGYINWLSVLVAAVLAFAVGGLWYSFLFSKAWQREININIGDAKKRSMLLIFGVAFLLNFVSAIFLDLLIGSSSTLLQGIGKGLIVSVAFVATGLGVNYLFALKSMRLYLIDAGYFVVYYMVMGAVLGAW